MKQGAAKSLTHSGSGSARFPEFAVIAGHIATRIGYAIAYKDADAKDEQQADFALRLIQLGRPGIEAAFFGRLGSEIHNMGRRRRINLLSQVAERRRQMLQECFNLNADSLQLNFVRDVLIPAMNLAHERWLANVKRSMAELDAQAQAKLVAANRIRAREIAERRAQQAFEKDLKRKTELKASREAHIQWIASHMADERKEFEKLRAIYRERPWFIEMFYGAQWIWFMDRLEKWGS